MRIQLALVALAFFASGAAPDASAQAPKVAIPKAVTADPPMDAKFPARMEVLHIPSGGVAINGVAYVASGQSSHPTFVLFHGLPGNEKNLDLAQAVRRAGWTVVTVNYRGSWGSPGKFSFGQNLEDARNTLAYLRDPANATKLAIDPKRIVIAGHSMGGWVTLETAAADPALLGAVTISEGDIGDLGKRPRAAIVAGMKDNMETLAGVTPDSMADELIAHADEWSVAKLVPALKDRRLLILYSNDFVKAQSEQLIGQLKAAGASKLATGHEPTDHSWSDKRIALEARVIDWLQALPGAH